MRPSLPQPQAGWRSPRRGRRLTVSGYDANGVYVMDPAKGTTDFYDWATFQELWSVVDGMGLAVYPM